MNILVFTPLYYIEGREDLIHDTSAIHYLVKYWSRDNNIIVIDTYLNYKNKIGRYFRKQNRVYYRDDYFYTKDNIKIYLVENQILTSGSFISWNWKHCIKHIRRILEKEDFSPDIVISHFPCYSYGFIDKIGIHTPKIAVVHESDVVNAKANEEFYKALEKKYSAVFCRSKKILDYFESRGLANIQKDIIYSGAPKNEAPVKRNWRDFRNRIIRILYVGKLIKRKNVDWIIKALHQKSNISFCLEIVGSGPEEKSIKQLVEELNMHDKVLFIDSLSRHQVLKKMATADVFCMPSINETFGLVYIEALSRGCITIGSAGEGIDGVIVDSKNGFLVNGYENLVECFDDIFNVLPIEEIQRISQRAVEIGELFSEENTSKRYLSLVKSSIEI